MQKKSKKVLSACSIASLLVTTTAVSTGVKAADSGVNRVGGANRYETAAKVADSGWTSSDYAIVANGEGYADALCATPLAKANNAPILLTTGDSSNSLEQNELNELKKLNVKHVIVIGGTGVVPDSVLNSIKAQVTDVERIGGQDRFETSEKIAEKLGTPTKAVIASGEGYADALSAGPAAAINGMPILLSRAGSLPDVISNYLKAHSQITQTYVIGGTASIADSILNSLPSAKRLGGQTRYDTNVAVLREFASSFKFTGIYAALGDGPLGNEFADALTGGALAAKLGNPLVITGKTISSATSSFLKEKGLTTSTLTVLGGTASIPDSVASDIKGSIGNPSTPPTPGGGGSSVPLSGELLNGAIVNDVNYQQFVKDINTGKYCNDFFEIKPNGSSNDTSINVQLKKNDRSVEDIFTDAQKKYLDSNGQLTDSDKQAIEDDVAKVNAKLDLIYNKQLLGSLTIGNSNKDLKTVLSSLGSNYIDGSGHLIATNIEDKIPKYSGTNGTISGYEAFKNDLTTKISSYFKNDSSTDTIIKYHGYTIGNIYKDSTEMFDSGWSHEANANKLVDIIFPSSRVGGTYTINFANSAGHFIIDVSNIN
ncbi:cell wall-binding repeat-containing protein [Clostridium ljungdahlii]|uniref:N-acetylmuramoyl-L-alanine amidase LytC n=1 Tax=Clostridium ljungdahlii TaxID=1538 RepID=A0A162KU13_9CLOT|nr:cell wall-binding repeat-containing protein [Clostridium ljungdahlii]OAA86922.1 N-acetylmuramoyl-L-alanine amidase LytC precursor [Clostridium ljungdahlii]